MMTNRSALRASCKAWIFALTGVVAVLTSMGAVAQTPVNGIYTCVDSKGRKLTSDRPIAECADREQKVLSSSGTVKGKLGPTLSAQERADLEDQEKVVAQEAARKNEEKRRDRALLSRYPTKAVHDTERAEALKQISVVKGAAAHRVEELKRQAKVLDEEMEFYKKDPTKAPQRLRRQVDESLESMAVQARFIVDQDAEIKRVNARFDEELQRLKSLWLLRSQPTSGAGKTAKTP